MRSVISAAITSVVALAALPSVEAATFTPEKTFEQGAWAAHLFRNIDSNRLFCAAETQNDGTELRINSYLDDGDTFLELFDPSWNLMPGAARFTLVFTIGSEAYRVEFRGESWGDSYTHDFTDVAHYEAVLGLLMQANSIKLENANRAPMAAFGGQGSAAAVAWYLDCVKR